MVDLYSNESLNNWLYPIEKANTVNGMIGPTVWMSKCPQIYSLFSGHFNACTRKMSWQ